MRRAILHLFSSRLRYTGSLCLLSSLVLTGCFKDEIATPETLSSPCMGVYWEPTPQEEEKLNKVIAVYGRDVSKKAPYSLGDLFDLALRNNPDTQSSWYKARASADAYAMSLSDVLPQIDLTADGEYLNRGILLGRGTGDDSEDFFRWQQITYALGAKVSYLLWDFGKRDANIHQFYQSLQSANWTHNANIQKLFQSVSDAYFDLMYQVALLDANEADLINAQEIYRSAMQKELVGVDDAVDVAKAKTYLLQQEILVTKQKNSVEKAELSLLRIVGIHGIEKLPLQDFPTSPPEVDFCVPLCEFIELAKEKRPDYIAAKANMLAQEASVEKAKAERWPAINFNATAAERWYSRADDQNIPATDGQRTQSYFNTMMMVELTYPIFNGFLIINQIKQEKDKLQEVQAELNAKEADLYEDVGKAVDDAKTAHAVLGQQEEVVENALIVFRSELAKFREGTNTILDVLSAATTLATAQSDLARIQAATYTSVIHLAHATGLLTTYARNPNEGEVCAE